MLVLELVGIVMFLFFLVGFCKAMWKGFLLLLFFAPVGVCFVCFMTGNMFAFIISLLATIFFYVAFFKNKVK